MCFRLCSLRGLTVVAFMSFSIIVNAQDRQESPTGKGSLKGQSKELNGDWFLSRESEKDLHPVRLSATYHYGNADKETVPVLLLHDLKGSRQDFKPLADMLSKAGYAVLAVDLRGHGESTRRYDITPPKMEMKTVPQNPINRTQQPKRLPVRVPGQKKLVDYKPDVLKPADQLAILRADLPEFRRTLENIHIEGLINLNRLVIVGIGRGAAAAAYWTLQDWRDRDSERFTKTLVLIAPAEMGPKGDYSKAFGANKWIRDEVAVMLAIPEGDVASRKVADKVRAALLAQDDNKGNGATATRFPMFVHSYPAERAAPSGEAKTPMTMIEIFSNAGSAKLGKTVFDYIDRQNGRFPEKEARWTKLR